MNAKEYLAQIVQKLQLLDDLGEEPSSLRIIEHMNLAVAFYRLHEIEHGIEISLEHFHCAKSLSNYILLQETDPSGSFHEFFITCIRYGLTIYQLGDAYVNDAESIFLFTQKMLEQASQAYLWEKGIAAYHLGILYLQHQIYDKAYEQFHITANVVDHFRSTPSGIEEIYKEIAYSNYFDLALCSGFLLKYDEQEKYLIQSVIIQYTMTERNDLLIIYTLYILIEMYLKLHQTEKAEQALKEAAKILQVLEQVPSDINYYYKYYQYTINEGISENKKDLEFIDSSLNQTTHFPMPLDLANNLFKHPDLLAPESPDQNLMAAPHFEFNDKNLGQIYAVRKSSYQLCAEAYDDLGETDLAIQNFQHAYQAYEKENCKNILWEITYWISYSFALLNGTRYNEARKKSETCIALIDGLELDLEQSQHLYLPVFINLGTIYMRQMQLDNAEIYLFKALNICWPFISQNLFDRTQFYADSAADLISRNTETNNTRLQIELYLIYANIQYQNGNLEESIQLIDKAIAKAGHTRLLLFNCYYLKGSILQSAHPQQAEQQYQNALEIIRPMKLEKNELYLTILLEIICTQKIPEKKHMDEIKLLLENTDIPGGYLKLSAYRRLIPRCITVNNWEDAYDYACKAVVAYNVAMEQAILSKNTEAILRHKDHMKYVYNLLFFFINWSDEDILDQIQFMNLFTYYKIGDYYLLQLIHPSFPADNGHNYPKIQLQLRNLQYLSKYLQQTDTKQTHELLLEKNDQLYWDEKNPMQEYLSTMDDKPSIPKEYMDFWIIDYYFPPNSFDENSPNCPFAVIWQPKALEKKQFVKLAKANQIAESIDRFRKAVTNDAPTYDLEEELYRLLVEPLIRREPLMKTAKNFIICPEGEVTTVPFDLFFGTDCRILYAPFADYIFAKSAPSSGSAAICANPVVTSQNAFGLSPLYDCEQECSVVASALQQAGYKTHIFYGDGNGDALPFEKYTLLDKLNTENYSVIHISTHGFYLQPKTPKIPAFLSADNSMQNPMHRCGLILNDSICDGQYNTANSVIWGEDILRTDLTGTKLAILSCCVSGLGYMESGNWLVGLQRSFFIAGVENLIVSLWEVDEKATSILMQYFYQNMCAGQPADLALQQAKNSLKAYKYGIYSTPYYWAGFIYIGKICII